MNHLFTKGLSVSSLAAMLLLSCASAGIQEDEKNDQSQIPAQSTAVDNQSAEEEKTESVAVREQDNADTMGEDEINKYIYSTCFFSNMAEKDTFRFFSSEALEKYFPNLNGEVWEVVEKEGNHYIAKFYGNGNIKGSRNECAYTGEFILEPNFTFTVLEDTIELHPENGFCAYTSGEIYAYQGCYIEECTGSYYDQQRNNRFDVSFPIYYTEDNAWRDFNNNIWTGLENWFVQRTENEKDVSIMLDYEIKTCSDGLFSILFDGQLEKKDGREDIAMALTVSVHDEKLLPGSMLVRGEEADGFYDYYIEDGTLYFISSEDGKWESVDNGKSEMQYWKVDRIEKHVYNANGCWLGNCYYEVPVLGCFPEELKTVSRHIRKDLGKFLTETAEVFEEVVYLLPAADIEYASEDDSATMLNSYGGYHCHVDTEVTYNNNGILEITYSYNVLETTGEAVAVYDLNTGTVLEHQDWQDDMIRLLQGYLQKYKK